MPANRYRFPLVENATKLRETSLSLLEGELNCSASLTFYNNGTFLKFNSSISIIGTNQIYSEKEFIPDDSGIFVCEKPPWYDLYDIRVLTTIVTFTISVTCLIIAFLIHLCTKTYNSTHDRCILSFSGALFFAQTASLVPHMNTDFCKANAILLHYLWLAVFNWTSVMAFDLAYTFSVCRISVLRSTDSQSLFKKYSLIGWFLPFVIVLICVLLDLFHESVDFGYGSMIHCWISNKTAVYISTTTPVVICLIFNFACIGVSIYGIEYVKKRSLQVQKNTKDSRRCTVYLQISIMLGVTWILAYVVMAYPALWLQVTHNIVNGCQGVYVLVMTIKHPKVLKGVSSRLQMYKVSFSKSKSLTISTSSEVKLNTKIKRHYSI
uniref:Latrophilin receptor-like protein A n=1 Tax=Crassostrea virginica TaxID=6565 RepID=A0A8B8F1S1_CRAVI|nr:latrophilin receptor-like protein A [Crassostrea virginica]